MDNTSANDIFSGHIGYTYDDLIILPGFIKDSINNINLETNLTSDIKLKTPFISSPMDTVTESDMAIYMALYGGIGFIHCNNTIEEQVEEVKKVKRYQNQTIWNPITFGPNNTIQDVLNAREQYKFSGFPIT